MSFLSNPFTVLEDIESDTESDVESDTYTTLDSDVNWDNRELDKKNSNLLETKCECATYGLSIESERKYIELQTEIHKRNLHLRGDSRLVSNYFEKGTHLTLQNVIDLLVETHLIYNHTLYKELRPALCGYELKDERYAEYILQQTLLGALGTRDITGKEKLCYCGKPYLY
jgi:hypothetical protein